MPTSRRSATVVPAPTPATPDQPTFSGNGTHSAIRWQLPREPGPGAGCLAHADLRDDHPGRRQREHVVPEHRVRALLRHRDQPARRDRRAPAAQQRRHLHRPARLGRALAPPTTPRSTRRASALDKSNLTDITEQNNGPNQAVVGETLTYTLQLRVPAHTSVFNGVLTDPMPTGVTYLSSSATYSATQHRPGHRPAAGRFHPRPGQRHAALPGRATPTTTTTPTCSRSGSGPGSAPWPATPRACSGSTPSRFDSQSAPVLGTDLPTVTDRSTVTVVAPQITLTKGDDDADNVVEAGQVVTYTLRLVGTSGRPPAHDLWVVDCVPERPDVRCVPRPAPRYGEHRRRDGQQRVCGRHDPDRVEPARQLDDRPGPPLHRDGLARRPPAARRTPTPPPPRGARSTTARPTRWPRTTRSSAS